MEPLFEPLRDDVPLPPSEVDIDRAVRRGRRRVKTRWLGAAALVVVVAFLVPILGFPDAGSDTGSTVWTVATVAQPPLSADDFDPMRRVVTVADVPGVTPDSYTSARRWQQVTMKVGESGFGRATVYAPGRQPTDGSGPMRPETGTPADPIGGQPAYWVTRGADDLLAWQWTDGAWAFVTVDDLGTGESARDIMRRIALAVRVTADEGAGEPVTMPFTLPRLQHDKLVGTTTALRPPGNPFVRTGLLFAADDPTDPDAGGPCLWVAVENGDKMAAQLGANQVVDDHPAMVHDGEVIIFDVADGFAVDVLGPKDTADLLTIAKSVRLVPTPNDRSTWTAQPLT